MKCRASFSVLAVSMLLCFAAFTAEVKDFYEITDLETGAKAQVPFVSNSVFCTERVIGRNDAKNVFYALREARGEYSLRIISYEGKILEEKPLPSTCLYTMMCRVSPNGESLCLSLSPVSSVVVFNLRTRQQERQLDIKSEGILHTSADGKKILLDCVFD